MYLYAIKQLRIYDANIRPEKCLFQMKQDTFVEVFSDNTLSYYFHFNVDISNVRTKAYICTYKSNYTVFQTREEALAFQEKELSKDKSKYVLVKDGKLFHDKKYKRISDVYTSTLNMAGYTDKFQNAVSRNISLSAKNPDLHSIFDVPEFIGGQLCELDDLIGVEIHKYHGAKKPTEKIEHDDLYIKAKKHFDTMNFALHFGICVKAIFSKIENTDFEYILVFTPNDYNENNYWDFTKEDISLKPVLKGIDKKSYIKETKFGKTAIAFKDLQVLGSIAMELGTANLNMFTIQGNIIEDKGNAETVVLNMIIDNLLK